MHHTYFILFEVIVLVIFDEKCNHEAHVPSVFSLVQRKEFVDATGHSWLPPEVRLSTKKFLFSVNLRLLCGEDMVTREKNKMVQVERSFVN
jgi:hypothetical protein